MEPQATPVDAPAESRPARAATPSMSRTRKLRIAAGSLAGAGAGLLVMGIAFEMQRARADSKLSNLVAQDNPSPSQLNDQQNKYDRGENLRWLGVGGGALMAAAVPMLRIDLQHGVPWWSYALGAGGAGLAVLGGVQLAKDGSCELYKGDSCYARHDTLGRGMLLLSAAAPLLTFPITHVLEWSLSEHKTKAQAYLAPSPRSLLLVVRKQWNTW
jgi:hypothetical protein